MILAAYKLTIAVAALITLFTIRDTDWEERMGSKAMPIHVVGAEFKSKLKRLLKDAEKTISEAKVNSEQKAGGSLCQGARDAIES